MTIENAHTRRFPVNRKHVEARRVVFVFTSFLVFTVWFLIIVVVALATTSTEFLPFVYELHFADGCDWVLLVLLLVHCVRMQLGILYNFEDPTYNNALKKLERKLARTIYTKNTVIWLLLIVMVGTLPRMLASTPFWAVFLNLSIQCICILVWQKVNKPVLALDKHDYGTLALRIGDGLFIGAIATTGVIALLNLFVGTDGLPKLIRTIFVPGVLWGALFLTGLALWAEVKYTYSESFKKVWLDLAIIRRAWEKDYVDNK